MEKQLSITLRPEKIRFMENCLRITDPRFGKIKIPYKNLVQVWIRRKDGSGVPYEPDIMDITEDMEGKLFFRDSENRCFAIQTELTGRPAGKILSDLSIHAPYILIGKPDWIDPEDEEMLAEIDSMVGLMRECR